MTLSLSTSWPVVLPTLITGALLMRLYFKQRSEQKPKKAPVPIRVRSRRPY